MNFRNIPRAPVTKPTDYVALLLPELHSLAAKGGGTVRRPEGVTDETEPAFWAEVNRRLYASRWRCVKTDLESHPQPWSMEPNTDYVAPVRKPRKAKAVVTPDPVST